VLAGLFMDKSTQIPIRSPRIRKPYGTTGSNKGDETPTDKCIINDYQKSRQLKRNYMTPSSTLSDQCKQLRLHTLGQHMKRAINKAETNQKAPM